MPDTEGALLETHARRRLPPWVGCLAPVASVVGVFVLYRYAHGLAAIDVTGLEVPPEAWIAAGGFGDSVDALLVRLSWGLALLVFLIACFVALGGGLVLLGTALDTRPPYVRRVAQTAVALLAAAGFALSASDPLTVPGLLPYLEHAFADGLQGAAAWLARSTALSVAAAVLLTVTTAATLLPPPNERPRPPEHLRAQIRRLRVVLYLGAAVLVAGTLLTSAYHHLPIPQLADGHREAGELLAGGVTFVTGALWSLVLLAMYVPAALILDRRAWAVATARDGESPARQGWLEEEGLTSRWYGTLLRVTAILAPFLSSGPAAALFELL